MKDRYVIPSNCCTLFAKVVEVRMTLSGLNKMEQ